MELAGVAGADCVTELQRASCDHEISERKVDAFGGLLASDTGDDLGSRIRQRIDRDGRFQIVQKRTAALADGGVNAVADLGDGNSGKHYRHFRDSFLYVLDGLGSGEIAALGGDENAGVQH